MRSALPVDASRVAASRRAALSAARLLLASFFATVLSPSVGWAAHLELVSVYRQVGGEAYVYHDSSYYNDWWGYPAWREDDGDGLFHESLVIVGEGWEGAYVEGGGTQTSTVSLAAGHISALGSALGGVDSVSGSGGSGECCEWWYHEEATASGYSSLDLVFDVLEPTAFDLDFLGTTTGSRTWRGWGRFGFGGAGTTIASGTWGGNGAEPSSLSLSDSGQLAPGRYRLVVEATTAGGTSAFDLALVVPEPGTALLVGAGLALLGRVRRGCSLRSAG